MKTCPGGFPIEKKPYETQRQFERRQAKGLCSSVCARKHPAPKLSKPLPSLTGTLPSVKGREYGGMIEKEKTPRDAAYLEFVRTFDCVECGWPAHMGKIEAHHIKTGGMAIKGSDYETVPLCAADARGCHAKADKDAATYKKYKPFSDCFNQLWVNAGHQIKG